VGPDAIRDFEIKRGKAALVLPKFFPVQIHGGQVIARSEMQK